MVLGLLLAEKGGREVAQRVVGALPVIGDHPLVVEGADLARGRCPRGFDWDCARAAV